MKKFFKKSLQVLVLVISAPIVLVVGLIEGAVKFTLGLPFLMYGLYKKAKSEQ